MLKRIRNSLSAKVFLCVFCALTICCIIVYWVIFALLPKQYDIDSYNEMDRNVTDLVNELDISTLYEGEEIINNFCMRYNTSITLTGNGEIHTYGGINTEHESKNVIGSNLTAIVYFTDQEQEFTMNVFYLSRSAHIITGIMLRLLPAMIAGILLLSLLSALICSKLIVSPIKKISRISKRMAELDTECRCDVDRSDEIGVLSDSLNTMASNLQKTLGELKDANSRLKEDIEHSKLLEEQKRSFFIAVSHELKTPLTVLKGQLENMMLGYGDYKDHEKYLPKAYESAEDIEKLVKEIIAITKTETTDISSRLSEVSLIETVNETVETIKPIAADKNITIHQQINEDMTLTVDKGLWSKALSNIIGNAVRHSPEGEQVFITLETNEDKKTLVVTNTGASIPQEDMPHLFTPFYRADKSRNRATGGSGLGLYIVKTILSLHDMTCELKNTDNGVSFYLYIQ